MLIIDADTGRDDALAMQLAWRRHLPIRAVFASYGNTTLTNTAQNSAAILGALGIAAPVIAGAAQPLTRHPLWHALVLPRHGREGNGLCNLQLPVFQPPIFAPDAVAAMLEHIDQPLDYIVTGPCTNLALLWQRAPDLLRQHIRRIVVMGGKLEPLWSEKPGADFNIACDPMALDMVLREMAPIIPVTMVAMNATWPLALDAAGLDALTPQDDAASLAAKIIRAYLADFSPDGWFRFHDPLCVHVLGMAADRARLKVITDIHDTDFGRVVSDDGAAEMGLWQQAPANSLSDMLGFLGLA